MRLSHKRLLVFVTLSLFLHVIWFMGHHDYRVFIPEQSGSLSIRLMEQKQALQTRHAPQAGQAPAPLTGENRVVAQTTGRQTAGQHQSSSASVLTEIRQKLTQHFVYPVMARRMGWQGHVLLGFQIDGAGSIQRVHVKRSSGYAILDDSAMAALHKIGKIAIRTGLSLNGNRQLEIPVIYRLEG